MQFKLVEENAQLPKKKHYNDAGYDVFSVEERDIPPRGQEVIHTGVKLVSCEPGICLQIWSKSGLDAEFGLHAGAGIIDPGYRGELLVLLKNMSDDWVTVEAGEAVAQIVPVKIDTDSSVQVVSERGEDGGIARITP